MCSASAAAAAVLIVEACSSVLSECSPPCSPFVTLFIPITTVAVGGNCISSSPVLDIAISVIVVTFPPGIKST